MIEGQLPNCSTAMIDVRKLHDYVLNSGHPEGRHKARVFLSALGITAADSEWLASTILQNLADGMAVQAENTPWGKTYRVDLTQQSGI